MIYFGLETFSLNTLTQIDLIMANEIKASKLKTSGSHHASFKKHNFHGQITVGYILKNFFKFEAYAGVSPLSTELIEDKLCIVGPMREGKDPLIAAQGDFRYILKKHTIFGFSSLLPVVFHPSLLPASFDYFFGKLYPFLGCHVALNYLRPIYQFNLLANNRKSIDHPSRYLIRPSIGPCVGVDFTPHPKWAIRFQYRYEYFPCLNLSLTQDLGHNILTHNISFKPSAHYFGGGLFYNFKSS